MSAVPTTSQQGTRTLQEVRNPAPREASLPVVRAGFFDLQGFELMQRVAKMFASSTLVPAHYQESVANCMIALNLARRLGADELMVMQNLYIVHGNPGWSSKFLIASVNTCGRFESLRYEWRGKPGADDFGCRAWTIEKSTGDRLDGIWVDWKMVKAEGWHAKNGSKWKTMPDQMFVYRAAAFWQRAYAPEISMGLSTSEELADVVDVGADGTVRVTTESLRAEMKRVDAEVVEPERAPATAAAQADPATGEISQQQGASAQRQHQAPAFDADAFAERLERCDSVEVLDLTADEIRDCPQDVQDLLREVYHRRRQELTDQAAGQQQAEPQRQAAPSRRRQQMNFE